MLCLHLSAPILGLSSPADIISPHGQRRAQEAWDAELQAMLPAPAPGCADPRAINDGQSEACAYDCDALTTHYFPWQPQPRCFLFDRQSMSWPAELLGLGAKARSG